MYYSTSLELNKIIKVLDKRENAHMEIFTLLTPCSVQGCVQGGNNLVNTMELQRFPPCYKVVNTLYHL